MFMVEIRHGDQSFKSSEHLYQCLKCKSLQKDVLAEKVAEADTALEAKTMTEAIKYVSSWFKHNEDAMCIVLRAKAESCSDFSNILLSSGSSYIVEATNDKYLVMRNI